MDKLISYQLSWGSFFVIGFALIGLYLVLQSARRGLTHAPFLKTWQQPLQNGVRLLLLIYEPLAILVLASTYFLINPVYHGLLLGLLLLIGLGHIRNYVSGRLIQISNTFAIGKRLSTPQLKGIIAKIGRLGLYLNTNQGLHYLSYTQLARDGYTLVSGEEVGGFYKLIISQVDPEKEAIQETRLMDLLTSAPYLDRNHRPQLKAAEDPKRIDARIVVQEEVYLYELIALIKEWGYDCRLSRS